MGYIPNTPEDRLERSDSKNPRTTCKGLTGAGNLCRNPVTPAKGKTLSPTLKEESLYCHHHKDQAASRSAQSSPGPRLSGKPILEQRTSIDTLADRLGLVDVGSNPNKKQKRPQGGRPSGGRPQPTSSRPSAAYTRPPTKEKELHFCFCFKIPIDEVQESQSAPRPQPRPVQNGGSAAMPRPSSQLLSPSNGGPGPSTSSHSRKSSQVSPQPLSTSQTAQYLSLIPPTTDPQTASALMAELARPYGSSEEPGYIYMFWITPTSKKEAVPLQEARSLLAPPSPARGAGRQRRSSDVVSAFSNANGGASGNNKMLIKIGRAANVQRRMQQWTKQCSYEIEVLRYYPYIPGASAASGEQPRMTPHVHRVERLIHIELSGMGLHAGPITCDGCNQVHREWFEVQTSKKGIGAVDEVIRRWADWDETQV
ncbi:meiotically up-regulated gene 113 protein [Colletotrichum spaethianum]|uniref:Meiotically up-regulated gene 113 protein n=1 Tax=Colletotrichum spaethianum TaxID=700344 RepID=A0AA37LHT3_9PEZI|nr:meiotically up-regulated gene 113 protein [Colletotrichum spaethianum]GKT46225.1 meiotically up-regulated gene 113 protein [Colletotrichum spaethianum]